MAKRYWRTSETFRVEIDIAHFGAAPLNRAVAAWRLVDDAGGVVARGALPPTTGSVARGRGRDSA